MAELFSLFTMFLPPVIYTECTPNQEFIKIWKSGSSAVNHSKIRFPSNPVSEDLALATWNNGKAQLSPTSLFLGQ